jgi:hypothetical protein
MQAVLASLSLTLAAIGILLFPFFGLGLYPALAAVAAGMGSLAIGASRGAYASRVALAGLTTGIAPWLYFYVVVVARWTTSWNTPGGPIGIVAGIVGIPLTEGMAIYLFVVGRRKRRKGIAG